MNYGHEMRTKCGLNFSTLCATILFYLQNIFTETTHQKYNLKLINPSNNKKVEFEWRNAIV
jgi:hypothetical protein